MHNSANSSQNTRGCEQPINWSHSAIWLMVLKCPVSFDSLNEEFPWESLWPRSLLQCYSDDLRVTDLIHYCSSIAMICLRLRVLVCNSKSYSNNRTMPLSSVFTINSFSVCNIRQATTLSSSWLFWLWSTSTIVNVSSCNCFWYLEKTVRMSVRNAIIFKLSKSVRKRSCFYVRRCEICNKWFTGS